MAKTGDARELTYVDLDRLIVEENTRSPVNMALEVLTGAILRNGVQEPLTVTVSGDKYEVQQGHRRRLCCLEARKLDPVAFKRLNPKGIPVIIRHDLVTEEDKARIKVDHGTQQSLRFQCELQRSHDICARAGMTEEATTWQLEGLFAKMGLAIPTAKRLLIKEERAKAEPDEKLIRHLVHETYKGQLQKCRKIWACPPIVGESLEYAETGFASRKGLAKHIRPKDVAALHTAFMKDMEVKEPDHTQKYSKGTPGPAFNAAWANLVKRVPVEKEPRDKAMSSKAMRAQIETGAWSSKGFQKLTLQHAGEPNVEGLGKLDEMLHLVELVKKYEPQAWVDFAAKAEKIKLAIANGQLK